MSRNSDSLPRGLVLFTSHASPKRRRRRTLFVTIMIIATLALIWPGYALVGGIQPFVFGLPFSLAWMVLWVIIVFSALVWLYRAELRETPSPKQE